MTEKHDALHDLVAREQPNICGIAAMKGGREVYCDAWNGFSPEDTVHVMSVTKSVVSLLVGIGIDRGEIGSIEQPVLDFFPDYRVKRGEKTIQSVTIRHLLTMTAPYKYRSEPWTRVCTSPDWTAAALDLLGGKGGITGAFRYSTLGIHVLTGILAQASGLSTVEYANRHLFAPLGIAPRHIYEAQTAEEHKAFILSRSPKGALWFSDPKGVGTAGYGLCLSTREMARIGQLCLSGGTWDGRQVVSSRWISESTRPRQRCGEDFGGMGYGFLWWTPDMDQSAYAALGNSGNAIYIDPDRDIVAAVSGTFKPNIFDRVAFIRHTLYPLLEGGM